MQNNINKSRIALLIAKIVSVTIALFGAYLVYGAVYLISLGWRTSSPSPDNYVRDGTERSTNALAGLLEMGFGFAIAVIAVAAFLVAATLFFGANWKLKKRAHGDPQTPEQIIPPSRPAV